jgi:hypothetical protein
VAAAAGVNALTTAPPAGNATAAIDPNNSDCLASKSEFKVVTDRIPTSVPINGSTAAFVAAPTNGVGFWLLVP